MYITYYSPRCGTQHIRIFPNLKEHERQTLISISWYTWHVAILSVPLSILQRRKEDRTMVSIDVAAKCLAPSYTSFSVQRDRLVSLTAELFNDWTSLSPWTIHPPPTIRVIPQTSEYLRIYFHEWA